MDAALNAGCVFTAREPRADCHRNRPGTSGRSADVGQRAGRIVAACQIFARVGGVCAESHVRRVGAAREVALVTDYGVIGAGPPESRNHTVRQLVGEKVCGHAAAP